MYALVRRPAPVGHRSAVDTAAVRRTAAELADVGGGTAVHLDVHIHPRDVAGRSAAVLVGIGPGPVEREDAVSVRRRRETAEQRRRVRCP